MPQFHSDAATARSEGMNPFLSAYIMAIYFTETGDGDQPDSEVQMSDDLFDSAYSECFAFQSVNAWLLTEAYEREGYDEARAGHDFWLTRNGHGAGFWCRDELTANDLGDKLADAARAFGVCEVYEGDDGLLY